MGHWDEGEPTAMSSASPVPGVAFFCGDKHNGLDHSGPEQYGMR